MRRFALLTLAALAGGALAQDTLTLDEALGLARRYNGTLRAAEWQVKAAGSGVRLAEAAFLPTVTPSVSWANQRNEVVGGPALVRDGTTSQVAARWRVLDGGERQDGLRAAQRGLSAQRFSSRQTLRETLFLVIQRYHEAQRAQELLRVAASQVERAERILDQTKVRVEKRDAPAKDILQAQADVLNARVSELQAKNRSSAAVAQLRAALALPDDQPLEALAKLEPTPMPELSPLAATIETGLVRRPDLAARRQSLEGSGFTLRRLRRDAGITFGVDATLDQQVTPDVLQNRTVQFLVSYPLFDGGQARETARESAYRLEAERSAYAQSERDARAEIEAAYQEAAQNGARLAAAEAALAAARENFKAALESQLEGAGTVIQVLTAQLSLVTSESNYVEALADAGISYARLSLVTGAPMLGE